MDVQACMRSDVTVVTPETSVEEAVRRMEECDIGILLVEENDLLVGLVSDWDVSVQPTAGSAEPTTTVREVMKTEIWYCFDDEDLSVAAKRMGELQIRRSPVLNRYNRLVGLLTIDEISRTNAEAKPSGISDAVDRARAYQAWEASERSHGSADERSPR